MLSVDDALRVVEPSWVLREVVEDEQILPFMKEGSVQTMGVRNQYWLTQGAVLEKGYI